MQFLKSEIYTWKRKDIKKQGELTKDTYKFIVKTEIFLLFYSHTYESTPVLS